MSRIALLAVFVAAGLLTACQNTVNGYRGHNDNANERRFIWGIPQNDR